VADMAAAAAGDLHAIGTTWGRSERGGPSAVPRQGIGNIDIRSADGVPTDRTQEQFSAWKARRRGALWARRRLPP
jgi:hypothetical protein